MVSVDEGVIMSANPVVFIVLPLYYCLTVIKWLLPPQTSHANLRQSEDGREKGVTTSMAPFPFENWKLPESLGRFLFSSNLPELSNMITPTFKESWGENVKLDVLIYNPYNYTVQVTNRFKGLDLIECLKNYGWRFITLNKRH